MKYEIVFNKYYKHSIELITKEVKGNSLYVDKVNDIVLIDNQKVADLQEVNFIRFLVGKHYQTIHVAGPQTLIKATDIEK